MLTKLFNCHINVEIVSSIKAVKYFYKYVYKGHDKAAVVIRETSQIEESTAGLRENRAPEDPGNAIITETPPTEQSALNHDEIQNYIETRYVSAVEASWRILNKPLHDKSHTIIRLPVHLPNEQSVTVNLEMSEDEIISSLDESTMLIAYFNLNLQDEHAKQYLYTEIPSYYTYKKKKIGGRNVSSWEQRKSYHNCIERMYSVSPTQLELFRLRLLLLTIKGATSFDNLRTVNGILHDSYSATCLALGLVEDDEEWKRAMHEAEVWMMPLSLRRLFVRILIHGQPMHPEKLWEEFKEAMSEDYTRYMGSVQGQRKAYLQINAMLCAEDRSLTDFPQMQQVPDEITEVDDHLSMEEVTDRGMQQYAQLNEKQKEVVDTILNVVDSEIRNESNCFYIDGPGGSGKTFVYTTLWYLLKSKNKRVTTMAFTGIAATLLPNGRTVHKTFGLPVPLFSDSSSNIKVQSKEGKSLLETDVFIWDEAPMAPRYALEVMNRTLQDIADNNSPFGGKIVILGGDFRQLLPVLLRGTRNEVVDLSIKFSPIWKHFHQFSLSENMRALPEEIEFCQFLLSIGNGTANNEKDYMEIPERCLAASDGDIVTETYGNLFQQKKFKEAAKCTILSARNIDVDEINKRVVALLDQNTERIYTSVDSADVSEDNGDMSEALLPEYLNSLSPSSLPPYELRLRLNTVVMLIRNLSIQEGLCNGTRLLILELGNNLLRCEILTGDKVGEIVFLNRITLYCENTYPFTFKRRQFPVKLAFAMTINKSQGQTFEKIGLDLRRDIFTHGQLYVACSRVRSWESLKIYLGNQRSNSIVKNHVYKELYA